MAINEYLQQQLELRFSQEFGKFLAGFLELADAYVVGLEDDRLDHTQEILAIENTIRWEDATLSGKVTYDAGGMTKWGLAKRWNPEVSADITLEQANRRLQGDRRGAT